MNDIENAIITAMMFLEISQDNKSLLGYGFNLDDCIWAAHSFLQFARCKQHSFDKAPEMLAKIEAQCAIEDMIDSARKA